MVALIKRLTNLDVVSNVLQSPAQYSPTRQGFEQDCKKLRGDVKTVTSDLNSNIHKYGNKKYAS